MPDTCGHIENMGDTFLFKEGKVCGYILAGGGGKIDKKITYAQVEIPSKGKKER